MYNVCVPNTGAVVQCAMLVDALHSVLLCSFVWNFASSGMHPTDVDTLQPRLRSITQMLCRSELIMEIMDQEHDLGTIN